MGFLSCKRPTPFRLFFSGQNHPGKTTLINYLKGNEYEAQYPTLGITAEHFHIGKIPIITWDVSGGYLLNNLKHQYLKGCDFLFFLIDIRESETINNDAFYNVYREFNSLILSENFKGDMELFVVFTKIDYIEDVLERDKNVENILKKLNYEEIINKKIGTIGEFKRQIAKISCRTGEGLKDLWEDIVGRINYKMRK